MCIEMFGVMLDCFRVWKDRKQDALDFKWQHGEIQWSIKGIVNAKELPVFAVANYAVGPMDKWALGVKESAVQSVRVSAQLTNERQ